MHRPPHDHMIASHTATTYCTLFTHHRREQGSCMICLRKCHSIPAPPDDRGPRYPPLIVEIITLLLQMTVVSVLVGPPPSPAGPRRRPDRPAPDRKSVPTPLVFESCVRAAPLRVSVPLRNAAPRAVGDGPRAPQTSRKAKARLRRKTRRDSFVPMERRDSVSCPDGGTR